MQNDVIGEHLNRLYEAMNSLHSNRMTEDYYTISMHIEKEERQKIISNLESVQLDNKRLTAEYTEVTSYIKEVQTKSTKLT